MEGKKLKIIISVFFLSILISTPLIMLNGYKDNNNKYHDYNKENLGDSHYTLYHRSINSSYDIVFPTNENYHDINDILIEGFNLYISDHSKDNEGELFNFDTGYLKIHFNERPQLESMVLNIYRSSEIAVCDVDDLITKVFKTFNVNQSRDILRIDGSNDWSSIISYHQKINNKSFITSAIGYSLSTFFNGKYRLSLHIGPFYDLGDLSLDIMNETEYPAFINNTFLSGIDTEFFQYNGLYSYQNNICYYYVNYEYLNVYHIYIDVNTKEIIRVYCYYFGSKRVTG